MTLEVRRIVTGHNESFARSRLSQEIQLCWERPGYHCSDRRVDSWTRHVLAPHGDLGLFDGVVR